MNGASNWKRTNEISEFGPEKPEFLVIQTIDNGICVYSKLFNPTRARDMDLAFVAKNPTDQIQLLGFNHLLLSMGPFWVYYAFTGGALEGTLKKLEWLIEVLPTLPNAWEVLLSARKTGRMITRETREIDELITEILAPQWTDHSFSLPSSPFGESHFCYTGLMEREFELQH